MYVTYFDEVKADVSQGQDSYWIGGIAIPMEDVPEIEGQVNDLARQVFGTAELTPDTEFHCKYLFRGGGPFKGMSPKDRIDILVKLVDILADNAVIKRVYARVITPNLTASARRPDEIAFAFFCERVQMLVRPHTTVLIGDQDDERVKRMIQDFSRYRTSGTFWDDGITIKNVADTVHFARSHHSRMLQLADVYLFYITHMYTSSRKGKWMADQLREKLKGKNLYAHRYKEWPLFARL